MNWWNTDLSSVFPLAESHDIIAHSERPNASTSLVMSEKASMASKYVLKMAGPQQHEVKW